MLNPAHLQVRALLKQIDQSYQLDTTRYAFEAYFYNSSSDLSSLQNQTYQW